MLIKKVLNANTILVEDDDRKECVYFGKGIGYGRKVGQSVEKDEVNRVFMPVDNLQIQEYLKLLESIPPIFLEITQEIVKKAEEDLGCKLNANIFFTLSDHLNFAIERQKNNVQILNRVFWEIKNYYPKEFALGEFALKLLKKELGQVLPQEEAANIAFHIINAQSSDYANRRGIEYAKMVSGISDIVRYDLGIEFDKNDIHYQRFLTHLKFFAERYFEDKMISDEGNALFEQIATLYPKAITVAFNAKDYVELLHKTTIPKEEVAYLAVHINRLMNSDAIDKSKHQP